MNQIKLFGMVISILLLGPVLAKTYAITDPYVKESQYGVDLYLEADNLDYTPPTWFKPVDHTLASESAHYWIHEVLPFEEDRYENMYLVIPGIGAITPIKEIPEGTSDFDRMVNGQEIEINKYLKGGIIEYVNSVDPGYRGKRIDFGHSNYYKSDTGRYKTVFANLMALDVNDHIWYFVKQPSGEYTLFKYLVTASYPTNPGNVQALQRDGEGADALIFGCYHGLDGRRMIEATYIGEPEGMPIEVIEDLRFGSVPTSLKNRIKYAVKKMKYVEERKQAYQIIQLFTMFEKIRDTYDDDGVNFLILEYMEELLAALYPEGL